MSRIKYAQNSIFTELWITRIGKLILNFAGLEFESYVWLTEMSEEPEKIPDFTKQMFKLRTELIIKYIKGRAFSEQWKADALKTWADAIELAKLRNRIAHNPILFSWSDDDEKGEPDLIGVPNMQVRNDQEDTKTPLISKLDIDIAINQIAGLVTQLESLRMDWCAIRDERNGL